MAKIGITINEVLRSFIEQLTYTYNKYIEEIDICEDDVKDFDLIKYFKFDNVDKLNQFMYLEAPLEIFGHADQKSDGLMVSFNQFLMDIQDDEEHEILLISREIDKSIPATNFFLSKTGCRATDIKYVKKYSEKWDNVDFLITANPDALLAKPNGKVSIKVKSYYNTNIPADFEIDSILDFIKDEDLREKILKSKTITYEEIKTEL